MDTKNGLNCFGHVINTLQTSMYQNIISDHLYTADTESKQWPMCKTKQVFLKKKKKEELKQPVKYLSGWLLSNSRSLQQVT